MSTADKVSSFLTVFGFVSDLGFRFFEKKMASKKPNGEVRKTEISN